MNTIVDVNESNKGLQTEMLFSGFFSVPLMTRKHLCKRHQGSTRQTESVDHRAGRNIKSFFPYKDRLARSLMS